MSDKINKYQSGKAYGIKIYLDDMREILLMKCEGHLQITVRDINGNNPPDKMFPANTAIVLAKNILFLMEDK